MAEVAGQQTAKRFLDMELSDASVIDALIEHVGLTAEEAARALAAAKAEEGTGR